MAGLLFHDAKPGFAAYVPPASAELRTDFFQNMRAGFQEQLLSGNFISRERNLFNAYEPIVQALKGDDGRRRFRNPYAPESFPRSARFDTEAEVQRIWQEVARRRKADPEAAAGLPGSREALENQVREQVLEARRTFEDISRRSTTSGAIGGFLGQTGAAMTDPPNLLSLTLGASASAGVLRTMLVESLIGVGTEMAIQPAVAAYYDELGIDYTSADFLTNVALGGAAGGVFAGGVVAARAVVRRAFEKRARGEELTPDEQAEAASAVAQVPEEDLPGLAESAGLNEPEIEDAAQNLRQVSEYEHPLPPDAVQADRLAHAHLVEEAETALEMGRELPSSEIPARYSPDPPPSTLETLDPLTIETVGALVGRLAPDEAALQTGLMRVLAQEAPANQTEAEAILRQFMALRHDDAKIEDLFGEQTFATSLIRERARLTDRVIKVIRNDKRIFEILTRNADQIEAAGNQLAEGNARAAEVAAQAVEIIMRLANRTGPVAEALNAGARKAKEQGRYDQATRDVVDAVRSAIERGDIDGLLSGGTGRTLADEAAAAEIPLFAGGTAGVPARAAATSDPARDLTGFAEPAGAGTEAQSDGLRIDLGEVDDSLEIDLGAGTDGQGNEVTERLTKSAVLERQDAEADFLDQLQVVCRTTGAAA